jgi:tetrahydromethanopterin S-methyltransferase subunit C
MNDIGGWSIAAICCVAIPLLFLAMVTGPVGLLAVAAIIGTVVYVRRGGKLEDLPDVIRQGFSKRDQ